MSYQTKDPKQRQAREQGYKPVGSGVAVWMRKCSHVSLYQHRDGRLQCKSCGDIVERK